MKIVLFFRKSFPNQYSIENVFQSIAVALTIEPILFKLSRVSKGILPRIKNGLEARRNQGKVNHITGDITYIAPFLKAKQTILTFHDFDFIKRSKGIKRWVLFFFWVYWPAHHVKEITVISKATKIDLLKLVKLAPEKISVIPNPLTLIEEALPSKAKNNTTPVLLHIGTKANKNLERLIKSIANLNIHLEIIGELTLSQKSLLQQYQINYQNCWNISKSDLIQKYKEADLLTFISTLEGFGLPILEAQALGCPVLTSNISAMPEVAGSGAYLVDPYDEDAIRKAVEQLINETALKADLIQKGYENIKRFQPKKIAQQYMDLYKEVAKS